MAIDVNELHTLCKALDKMITSERKEVKDAFRELAIMVTLIDSNEEDGPLTTLLKRLSDTEYRLSQTERRMDEHDRRQRDEQQHRRRFSNPYDRDMRWEHNNPFIPAGSGTGGMSTEDFQRHVHGIWNNKDDT